MLARWDPISELRRMDETMERLWRGFGGVASDHEGYEAWAVPVDITESGDKVVVRASMPGMLPEDIKVAIEDGVLTIRGEAHEERQAEGEKYLLRERRGGSFYRALTLPNTVDPDKAQTVYEHGVVSITFPKLPAKKAKDLKVAVGGSARSIEGQKAKAA